ncbi:MAG: NfeD family protein [Thermoplasmatota archaeon]
MAEVALWISTTTIIVGLALILLEVINPGFFIAVPGTVLAGFGFASLIAPSVFFGASAAWAIPIFGVPATLFTMWAYKRMAPPDSPPETLSEDSLPGRQGTVERDIPADDAGRVRIEGQSIRAVADEPLAAGTRITVVSVDGLTVKVEKI